MTTAAHTHPAERRRCRKTDRTSAAQQPALSEPIVIARFWRNRRGEAVVVQLKVFEGRPLIDVRMFYTAKDGTLQPSSKGIACVVQRLPELADAISKALATARELGLLPDEGRQ